MKGPLTNRTGAISSLDQARTDPPDHGQRFANRHEAGRRLAALLERFREDNPLVVGIPRGGVPVAAEVARALSAPLEIVVVRKIGAPGNPEYAIGALAEGGVSILDDESVRALGVGAEELAELLDRAREDLGDYVERYRHGHPALPLDGRTVLLVDDGLATGRSACAAARALRQRGAARVILAVPVAAPSSVAQLRNCVEDVIFVEAPVELWAIGLWYEDFSPTTDKEVAMLIDQLQTPGGSDRPGAALAREVRIDVDNGINNGISLTGDLALPLGADRVVAFAHGSGSSRLSPRNRSVAAALNRAAIGTLLFDLLTPMEEIDRAKVFDIALLSQRLLAATRWLAVQPETCRLPIGYFGASTGAAAALLAAAELGPQIGAIVARGGRPDLVLSQLDRVSAPTLLIVGAQDLQVLELNREAQEHLHCPNRLAIVPRATHLFEEPGALEEVARLAIDWFAKHLLNARASAEAAGRATEHHFTPNRQARQ
jgi:putative phosphoribosyl transferase